LGIGGRTSNRIATLVEKRGEKKKNQIHPWKQKWGKNEEGVIDPFLQPRHSGWGGSKRRGVNHKNRDRLIRECAVVGSLKEKEREEERATTRSEWKKKRGDGE